MNYFEMMADFCFFSNYNIHPLNDYDEFNRFS